jgi:hypothetical protein
MDSIFTLVNPIDVKENTGSDYERAYYSDMFLFT